MKIAILTREATSDYNAIVNGVTKTYLDMINDKFYPILIDSTLSLDKHKEILLNELSKVNGVILPGGDKISAVDLFVIDYCYKFDIPLLGICLGMQEIAYYFNKNAIIPIGNNTHMDMEAKYLHEIELTKNGYLYSLLKTSNIKVNSRHKYQIIENENYTIEATSNNVIEAIKVKSKNYILGVQFHPEIMIKYDNNVQIIIDNFLSHINQ